MVSEEDVIERLKEVDDPEIGMDVWTLNLIYEIGIEDNEIDIEMTFTTPFCPYGPQLVESIKDSVRELEGIEEVDVEVTFDPPWQPPEELQIQFGTGGPKKE